jgi:hypothetical protein
MNFTVGVVFLLANLRSSREIVALQALQRLGFFLVSVDGG